MSTLCTHSISFNRKQLVHAYPVVAKSLRDIRSGKKAEERKHCCGMTLQDQGVGAADLDVLLKSPQSLEFILGKKGIISVIYVL